MEIRRYEPYIVARAEVEAESLAGALDDGFSKLAGYIFGKNKGHSGKPEKLAMTIPVSLEPFARHKQDSDAEEEEEDVDERHHVSFVMPSKQTLDSLPRPADPDIHFVEMPAETLAAIAWRGGPWAAKDGDLVQFKREELEAALKLEGIKFDEDACLRLYTYYPPFAAGFMRLFEVLLPVEDAMIDAPSADKKTD